MQPGSWQEVWSTRGYFPQCMRDPAARKRPNICRHQEAAQPRGASAVACWWCSKTYPCTGHCGLPNMADLVHSRDLQTATCSECAETSLQGRYLGCHHVSGHGDKLTSCVRLLGTTARAHPQPESIVCAIQRPCSRCAWHGQAAAYVLALQRISSARWLQLLLHQQLHTRVQVGRRTALHL